MITYTKEFVGNGLNGKPVYNYSIKCVAADVASLPTGADVNNGSTAIVMDTGAVKMFDASGAQWVDFGG